MSKRVLRIMGAKGTSMAASWDLPRPPEYFLDRMADLQRRMLDRIYDLAKGTATDDLAAVAGSRGGDTIFAIDLHAEEVVEEVVAAWGEDLPLLLIAEGIPGDGGKTYPEGTPRSNVAFTCIVDPIDGTRGLMYGKRSAWMLTGVAPPPAPNLPRLDQIRIAMQTELPTSRSHLSDILWAVQGRGVQAETHNLLSGEIRPFVPSPSHAESLLYGFGTVTKFFPGGKVRAAQIEDRLLQSLFGAPADGNPQLFDDEYISSGGQLYELMVGHDRFIADLRPILLANDASGAADRLCAHPYDLCTALIAREAGVLITDERGGALQYPLDIRADCGWIGYANASNKAQVEGVLLRLLDEDTRLPASATH